MLALESKRSRLVQARRMIVRLVEAVVREVGNTPIVSYSAPMPRTNPVITRPFDRTSSIANSSAMVSGLLTSGRARPRIATLTGNSRVRSMRRLASRFGAAIIP